MIASIRRHLAALLTCLTGSILLSGGDAFAQPTNIDLAKKEGKVVIYGTIVPQIMTVIQKAFEDKYGVKVEYWRADATKVVDRAMTEWRTGRAGFDLVTSARGGIILLKQENVFAKYTPASVQNFPARFRDRDGQLTPWRVTPIGVLYNTDLVKADEAPRSLDDLLNPKWRGKIAMPDPTQHTSTTQFLWNIEKLKGERWMEFVRNLAKANPRLVDSFAPIPSHLVRGEASLGITYVQYVVQNKGPLGYAPLDKYLTDPTDAALSAKAANPNAARLFIDFLGTPEAQKKVAETGEFVLSPGVYPPIKDAEKIAANMVFMDNMSEEQLQKLRADFRPMFYP
ncbi:MAG TPA: extracellular solute-binding protein [Candidatus Binatia bacterium]|jgi:iron(III) transport system substrate-binding protein